MPTKKKTTPETEAAVKTAPAPKKKTVRTAAAATHKSPARKSAVKPAAKAAAASAVPAETVAFDVAAHRAEIEQEAYFLFVNRGWQHGHEHADWLRAIEIVKARY